MKGLSATLNSTMNEKFVINDWVKSGRSEMREMNYRSEIGILLDLSLV
jgi:hypothetical protein